MSTESYGNLTTLRFIAILSDLNRYALGAYPDYRPVSQPHLDNLDNPKPKKTHNCGVASQKKEHALQMHPVYRYILFIDTSWLQTHLERSNHRNCE